MEQAENETTVNPEDNGKDGTAPLRRQLVKDGVFRWDEESEASIQTQLERDKAKIQTLKEQAKNNQRDGTAQNLKEQAKNETTDKPQVQRQGQSPPAAVTEGQGRGVGLDGMVQGGGAIK